MKFLRNLVSAILGGVSIGIGSAAYFYMKDQSIIAAALLFSAGFLAVVIFDFGLFTDKSGNLFTKGQTENNLKKLLTTLIGNMIGSFLMGLAFLSEVNIPAREAFANDYYNLDANFVVSSIICGMLIFIALHGYRKSGGITGCAILIISAAMIAVFDFEYALLNFFMIGAGLTNSSQYFAYALQIFGIIALSAIGNAIGAIVFASLYRFKESTESSHHRHHRKHHEHKDNYEEAGK